MSGERILVVDDNLTNLKLMQLLLTRAGFDVHPSARADEALTMLRSMTPDLILVDLQLPDVDGLTLTRQLKADPATRDIPIVAVTASAMKGDEEKARAAGCDGYLTKPIDTRELTSYLARYLGRSI
jgi:two-component system, cell cycle response regulator DivK